MYFVHPLTNISVDVLTDDVPISTKVSAEFWLTYRLTIGRYLGRYSGQHSADTLTIDCPFGSIEFK